GGPFVGKRYGQDLERSPCQELRQPGIFLRVMFGPPQHSVCPDHKNTPQVAIALLGNRTELLFAPGRILSRYEPNPGRKITTRAEGLRVGDSADNSARANDANAGDALQPLARLIRPMLLGDPLLDLSDHRLNRQKLSGPASEPRERI